MNKISLLCHMFLVFTFLLPTYKMVKEEVKLSVCLSTMSWRHIGGVKVKLHSLTLALHGGEWSATLHPYPQERAPSMGPRANLDMTAKRNVFTSAMNQILVIQPVASHLTDWVILLTLANLILFTISKQFNLY
jgi:hypothetical protein